MVSVFQVENGISRPVTQSAQKSSAVICTLFSSDTKKIDGKKTIKAITKGISRRIYMGCNMGGS